MSRTPIVIAHRGASGYLPEHTLPAKAMAHGMGADFLEQDVVASRDGELLVFHDLYLDQLTDVAQRFPGRARPDGLHYCIDFNLSELRELRVSERRRKTGPGARFAGRFPVDTGRFGLHTLEEELDLVQGLNRSTGRRVGVYAEIKDPAWHQQHNFALGDRLIETLGAFGYRTEADNFFVQCFSASELRRVRSKYGAGLPMIQLLDEGATVTHEALRDIAKYARGIGPDLSLAWPDSGLVALASELGLLVHAFTFRADQLPDGFATFTDLLKTFLEVLKVDGVFTDFPDLVVRHLNRPG